MLYKKAKTDNLIVIALVGVIIFLLVSTQGQKTQSASSDDKSSDTKMSEGTTDTTVRVVGAPCTLSTTATSSMLRRYTEGSLSSENVTVFQNGVEKVTINHGATTQVQSGPNADTLDLYPALQSTAYYSQHAKGKLTTCTGSATTGDPIFELVQDTTPGGTPVSYDNSCEDPSGKKYDCANKVVFITDSVTIDITNDGQSNAQNGILNEAAGSFENLSIGTGSSGSVSLQFKVDYNEAWGPNGGNIAACQFPQAVYDSVTPLILTVEGVQLPETNEKPSTQLFPLIAANSTVRAFKFPGIDGRKNTVVKGTLQIKADSLHNPAMAGDRINCTVFDTFHYKRQNVNFPVLDIENRDTNADLGGANTLFDFVVGVE